MNDDLLQIAGLGIVNAIREHHGLERIAWDFPAFSSEHKSRALEQGAGALTALREAGYVVVPADSVDPSLKRFTVSAKLATAVAEQLKAFSA